MKVSSVIPKFKPISLVIEFHSQEELDKMTSIFNYTPICNLVIDSDEIFEELESMGGDFKKHWTDLLTMVKNFEER